MNYFPKINRWLIPEQILAQSINEMAIDGRMECEGTCFWLGQRVNSEATVSHLAILRGAGVRKSAFNVSIAAELMRELHDQAIARGLTLLAQVHSHSSECGVDMSATDHAYGVSVPFFLSIICPDYAQNNATKLLDCGIHICLPGKGYVRVRPEEVMDKIVQLPGLSATTLVAGGVV